MKNYLVTGVSRGLGLKITEEIVEGGDFVYGVARNSSKALDSLIEKYPSSVKFLSFDLSHVDSIKDAVFKDFIGLKTPLHGFVDNAAIAYDDIISNLNYEKLSELYKVNVFSAMVCTKYSIRNFILHNSSGSIVHISSVSAHTGYKGLAMYASTKGAIEAFSKNTAREWGIRKIRSNCLVAGFMETDMSASLSKEQKEKIFNRTSLKIPADTASVAKTVVFLLGDSSKSITGQNIFVDSGTL